MATDNQPGGRFFGARPITGTSYGSPRRSDVATETTAASPPSRTTGSVNLPSGGGLTVTVGPVTEFKIGYVPRELTEINPAADSLRLGCAGRMITKTPGIAP